MSGKSFFARISPALLIAPLFIFIATFFVWPLVGVMSQAVSDKAVYNLLPLTADAIEEWDGQSEPSKELQLAFVTDLRNTNNEQAVGDMVRRLNSGQSGFRSLMSKTIKAVEAQQDGPIDLVDLDKKWGQPQYWKAIAEALPPYTDRYLLEAIDMTRDEAGEITNLPPE